MKEMLLLCEHNMRFQIANKALCILNSTLFLL